MSGRERLAATWEAVQNLHVHLRSVKTRSDHLGVLVTVGTKS